MTTETITIMNIETGDAVKNIGDLKNNIKILKKDLEDTTLSWEEQQAVLKELKVNQNALKDAMFATTASLTDVAKSARGTGETYNALVHRMAELKEKLRSTDVSTDEGRVKFSKLADEINNVNDKLKRMDALQGNFQRNVGNYSSAFKGISENIDAFGKASKFANMGIGDMKDGFDALSKSPTIALFGMLVSVTMSLAANLKENETLMTSLKKVMTALKPVMDFFSGVLENVASFLADIIEKVVPFITNNGLFDKIVNGVVGVGNAIVKYITAPFKGVIEAIKIFKEQGVRGLGDAAKAFGQEMKEGFAFKTNFKAGEAIAETLISGAKNKNKDVEKLGTDLAKEVAKGVEKYDIQKEFDRIMSKNNKEFEDDLKERLEIQKEIDAMTEEELARTNAEIERYFEEQRVLGEQSKEEAEKIAEAKIATMQNVASGMSSVLGTIADLYEQDENASKKNAEKIKALRIASATIDTIQGALAAFTSCQETYPQPYGTIIGAIQSGVVTATGMSQIAKIKSTSATGGSSVSLSSGVTTAPEIPTDFTNTRTIQSASEEERLNKIASSQRVYILASDIESSSNAIKTRVAESSF